MKPEDAEPSLEEMVQILKERRYQPFGPSAFLHILIEMLGRPLSKADMQRITNSNTQRSFLRTFEPVEGGFIRKIFGKNELGRDIIKYELTEKGREFVLTQLDILKAFYKASGKKDAKK